MGFKDAVSSALGQYATFTGRARRSEFWWFFLFQFLMALAAAFVDASVLGVQGESTGPVGWAVTLALFLPGLAAMVRRLHDTGRNGWWVLVGLIPIAGLIVMLVFMVEDSALGNKYGPSPKHHAPVDAPYLNG